MGDNTLVLGHRVSEWCGVAPVLEEDIALANTALDMIGQTQLWLGLAGQIEGKSRDADTLAFHRDVWDFRNVLLVEQPNGDFGHTMMRQFLFDGWHLAQLKALMGSSNAEIAAIAEKSTKEVTYHLERSSDTVIGLGDGTEESHNRMQKALDRLWPYVGEMFVSDAVDEQMVKDGIAPDPASLREGYDALLSDVFTAATLVRPTTDFAHKGGKSGVRHSEHLGHMLTQMQWLQRAYPDASW
ncbi:1,2-phenylacetyl-CoA epoxidase subunit PaaC [Sulfitobacter sp. SK011]|jgi:ring-1,2-phenylacetyl-CoA epoxidase subunit PaaC|uniref:1,2-phenylacetyl-CoA epoxidase subunit PaaC n=1 Tax=Sulfitobacter sp. SK011 TaxID=1389004 RepID=UPI000E0A5883|nr:1,2-phenylacetyl-CoA epoxidase subunit PaaC [Sulfitobacter sp. SK011]AXI44091.1 phenylacetate-CoA oxygenase subunit PaaI [Sulfitobacter sp. SK011]